MAVEQYPHTLSWETEGQPATLDPITRIPIPGQPGIALTAECRYENFQRGGSREYVNKNGETVFAKGRIFLKKGQPYPKMEDRLVVTSPEHGVVYEGPSLHIYKGQLNTTIVI